MALTNYCIYKWLIFLLETEADEQHGMTLKDINQRYLWDRKDIFKYIPSSGWTRTGLPDRKKELVDAEGKKYTEYLDPKITPKTFLRWRHSIYEQFGLLIQQPIFKNIVQNRYYLANPELLDENKTLRETLEHLVDEEKRGYETKTLLTVSPRGRKKKADGVSSVGNSMGFVSVGGSDVDYPDTRLGYQDEPEMVGIIQFVMSIGEALVIKYGKMKRPGEKRDNDKDKKYVLEPQQLKCINGRWYVVGNLYEYGNRETSHLVIYDVERIRLCEDEDILIPRYQVNDGFDIYNLIPDDWTDYLDPDKVVSLYLKTTGQIFDDQPFCQAQMKLDDLSGIMYTIYKVYVKPDKDFLIQYLAYGDEMRVVDMSKKIEPSDTDITRKQIKYLNDLRKITL